jgi:hypothetical protein
MKTKNLTKRKIPAMDCGWPSRSSDNLAIHPLFLHLPLLEVPVALIAAPRSGYVFNMNYAMAASQQIDSRFMGDQNQSPVFLSHLNSDSCKNCCLATARAGLVWR